MKLKVEELLDSKGIKYRLIKLSDVAYTVDDVINNSDGTINPKEICKTIIIVGKKTGKKIASPEIVKEASGVEPGAVCPFLLSVPLFIDTEVVDLKTVNCGSGDHLYGIEFKLKDLISNTDHQITDLSKTIQI